MELNYFRDRLFDLLNDSGEGGWMDDRKLTVYNGRGAFKKSPSQILLQGNWLEQAGFSVGDKITVKCQQG